MNTKTAPAPIERRALQLAEVIAEASGHRWMSGQLPGLALIIVTFAENELRLARRLLDKGVGQVLLE
jgi:hypothetical protein